MTWGQEEVNQMLFKNNLGQSDRNLSFSTLGSRSLQYPEDSHGYTAISGSLWILCFRILRWPWSFQCSGLPLPVYLTICPGHALTSVTKSSCLQALGLVQLQAIPRISCWVVLHVQNLYRVLKSQTLSVTGRGYLIQCPHLNNEKEEGPGPKARLSSQSFLFTSSTSRAAPSLGISTLGGTSLPAVCNYTHR